MDEIVNDDVIGGFLANKLLETKTENQKLERKLQDRKDFSAGGKHCGGQVRGLLLDGDVWKRIVGKIVVFGVPLINAATDVSQNIQLYLGDVETKNCGYYYYICERSGNVCASENCLVIKDGLQLSNEIRNKAYLIIVMDLPEFEDCLGCRYYGALTYKLAGLESSFILPEISVSADDISDRSFMVDLTVKCNEEDLLSALFSRRKTRVVMVLPQKWSSLLDNTFEIHCSLTKLLGNFGCKMYFIANNVSELFNGSILEVHNYEAKKGYHLAFYTENQDRLRVFLHHLNRYIPGVLFECKI